MNLAMYEVIMNNELMIPQMNIRSIHAKKLVLGSALSFLRVALNERLQIDALAVPDSLLEDGRRRSVRAVAHGLDARELPVIPPAAD